MAFGGSVGLTCGVKKRLGRIPISCIQSSWMVSDLIAKMKCKKE